MVLTELKEILARESPKIRTEYILKKNIEINEEAIPQLEALLDRLKAGEKPKVAVIGSLIHLFPDTVTIEKELRERKEKLPKLRRWLKEVV